MKYSNEQIAGDFALWSEYIDTGANMDDEEFNNMSLDQRLNIIEKCFGGDEDNEN